MIRAKKARIPDTAVQIEECKTIRNPHEILPMLALETGAENFGTAADIVNACRLDVALKAVDAALETMSGKGRIAVISVLLERPDQEMQEKRQKMLDDPAWIYLTVVEGTERQRDYWAKAVYTNMCRKFDDPKYVIRAMNLAFEMEDKAWAKELANACNVDVAIKIIEQYAKWKEGQEPVMLPEIALHLMHRPDPAIRKALVRIVEGRAVPANLKGAAIFYAREEEIASKTIEIAKLDDPKAVIKEMKAALEANPLMASVIARACKPEVAVGVIKAIRSDAGSAADEVNRQICTVMHIGWYMASPSLAKQATLDGIAAKRIELVAQTISPEVVVETMRAAISMKDMETAGKVAAACKGDVANLIVAELGSGVASAYGITNDFGMLKQIHDLLVDHNPVFAEGAAVRMADVRASDDPRFIIDAMKDALARGHDDMAKNIGTACKPAVAIEAIQKIRANPTDAVGKGNEEIRGTICSILFHRPEKEIREAIWPDRIHLAEASDDAPMVLGLLMEAVMAGDSDHAEQLAASCKGNVAEEIATELVESKYRSLWVSGSPEQQAQVYHILVNNNVTFDT